MKVLLNLVLWVGFQMANAQGFWLTTRDFQGGPKTAFAALEDSILLTGTAQGIWRSDNEGYNWTKRLTSSPIYSLHAAPDGTIAAGGKGKLFISKDRGLTWDSIIVATPYPIVKIIETKDHEYFFIASGFTNEEGFVGDGVFYNNGDLLTWQQRNNGLPAHLLSAEQLAVDKNGRVYVAVPDENTTGQGGLYYSDNDGVNWTQSPLTVTNLGTVKVLNNFAISISPQDSLIISVRGTAVNISAQLNLIKHIDDVSNTSVWRPMPVRKTGNWWEDLILNPIHFAKNGDWYSSVSNSPSQGGAFYSVDQGKTWVKKTEGMGISITTFFEPTLLAEASSGKIFMAQLLDERVYYTNKSLINPIQLSGKVKDDLGNPIAGVSLTVKNISTSSNQQGDYSIIVPGGWSGFITPALSNYAFEPDTLRLNNLAAPVTTLDFTGTYTGTYFISGYVKTVPGQPAPEIQLIGFPQTTITNEFGFFLTEVPARWSGTVTPVFEGYQFTPASISFSEVRANLTDKNFSIRKNGVLYIIGRVEDGSGLPLPSTTLTGFPETTRIDGLGNFFGEVPIGWSGIITPLLDGYRFMPEKLQINSLQSDMVDQKFIASPVLVLSGHIKNEQGESVVGIPILGLPQEIFTTEDGSYRIELPLGWAGTITPSSTSYTFNPPSIFIAPLTTSLANQNFMALLITAVEDEETYSFDVYPNPTLNSVAFIKYAGIESITILNTMSQAIWSGNPTDLPEGKFEFPGAGVYYITTTSKTKSYTIRVVAN